MDLVQYASHNISIIKKLLKASTPTIQHFEPTQYYIAGTRVMGHKTNYAILLKPNGIASLFASGGSYVNNIKYRSRDGKLKTYDADSGNVDVEIVGNKIIHATANALYDEAVLQKIPDTNAFTGKMFKGVLADVNGEGCIAFSVRFDGRHMGYCYDGSKVFNVGHNYTLQNNGVATCCIESFSCDIHFHDQLLFVMVDRKLSVSWISSIDGKHSRSYYGELALAN